MGKFAAETEAQSRERLSIVALLDVLREPAIVLDGRFRVVAANASFHSQFGTAAADIDGRPVSEIGDAWNVPALHHLLEVELPQRERVADFAIDRPNGSPLRINAVRLNQGDHIVLTVETSGQSEATVGTPVSSTENLIIAINSLPVGVGFTDITGRFVLANPEMQRFATKAVPSADDGRRERWRACDADGRRLDPTEYPAARAMRGETVRPGIEFSFLDDGGRELWTRVAAVPMHDKAGQVTGAAVVVADITARKLVEERLKLLAQEVDHRSKNVLTLVATLVRLTSAESVAAFKENLLGRLNTLARAHQLLAETRWHGADLHSLVAQELAAYRSDDSARVTIEGKAIEIQPSAAQALSMAVHELATNAAKYGALSAQDGRVSVAWTLGAGELRLLWRESGGPRVMPPERRGLGSDIILRSIEHQLDGKLRKDWEPAGLVCEITVPASTVVQD